MIPDYEDLAEYIITHYRNKVIEVGVGNLPQVALLFRDKLDVVVTDINPQNFAGVKFCIDDIFNPDMGIYRNASLIYSVRPPIDIQDAIAKVAKETGSDLIIRPFGSEKADLRKYFKEYSLVNYKKARFYLYQI
ncbi:MAG: UPF0146 family protein [Candidatus Methanoperedens sp.]|nr:UPF0146 family protein [Candidatus Methanoperedens sp.]